MLVREGQHYESFSGFWALFPLPSSFSQLSNASGCCRSRNSYCNVEHSPLAVSVFWLSVHQSASDGKWRDAASQKQGSKFGHSYPLQTMPPRFSSFSFLKQLRAPQMRMLHCYTSRKKSYKCSLDSQIFQAPSDTNPSLMKEYQPTPGAGIGRRLYCILLLCGFVSHVFQRHNSGQLSASLYDKNFRP